MRPKHQFRLDHFSFLCSTERVDPAVVQWGWLFCLSCTKLHLLVHFNKSSLIYVPPSAAAMSCLVLFFCFSSDILPELLSFSSSRNNPRPPLPYSKTYLRVRGLCFQCNKYGQMKSKQRNTSVFPQNIITLKRPFSFPWVLVNLIMS